MKNVLLVAITLLIFTGCSENLIYHYIDESNTKFSTSTNPINLLNQNVTIINFAEQAFESEIPKLDSLFTDFCNTYSQNIEIMNFTKLPENIRSKIKENLYYKKPLEEKQIEMIYKIIDTKYLLINYITDFESVVSAAGINQQTYSSTINGLTTFNTTQTPYTFYFNGMQSNCYLYKESKLVQIDLLKVKTTEEAVNQNDFDYSDLYLSSFFNKYYIQPILFERNLEWKFPKNIYDQLVMYFHSFLERKISISRLDQESKQNDVKKLKEIVIYYDRNEYEYYQNFLSELKGIGLVTDIRKSQPDQNTPAKYEIYLNYDCFDKFIINSQKNAQKVDMKS